MEDLARVSLQSRHKPDDLLVAKVPLITIPTSLSGAEVCAIDRICRLVSL